MTNSAEVKPDVNTPFLLYGKVVTGFARGSKQLGFPTANLEFEGDVGHEKQKRLKQGVYHGFARVGGETHIMAMSVGDNPHFGDAKVTVEVHMLHTFDKDFYGEMVSCVVTGYIRPMVPFDTLEGLIAAIQSDCDLAASLLKPGEPLSKFADHPFLSDPSTATAEGMQYIL